MSEGKFARAIFFDAFLIIFWLAIVIVLLLARDVVLAIIALILVFVFAALLGRDIRRRQQQALIAVK